MMNINRPQTRFQTRLRQPSPSPSTSLSDLSSNEEAGPPSSSSCSSSAVRARATKIKMDVDEELIDLTSDTDDDEDQEMAAAIALSRQQLPQMQTEESLMLQSMSGVNELAAIVPQQLQLLNENKTLQEFSAEAALILNMDSTSCDFCSMQLKEKEGVMLNTCLHSFCRECVTSCIELQDSPQVKCPLNDGRPTGCDGFLFDKEIKALVPDAMYQKYLDRSVQMAKKAFNVFQCTTPGCDGWCEYEPGLRTFVCYLCSKTNCVQCKAVHDGIECVVYQKFTLTGRPQNELNDLIQKEKKNGWQQLQVLISQQNGNMQNVFDADFFVNTMEFYCEICTETIEPGLGVILQDCLHLFCKECLSGLIQSSDEPEVKCPYIDGNFSCTNHLKPREVKALSTPEIYDNYLQKSMKIAESAMKNSYHCLTPDCNGWCELDGENVKTFNCYVCKQKNCLDCKVIHKNKETCEDFKNRVVQNENDKKSEEALATMLKKGEAMKCPKCGSIVQKLVGCDWLVCYACKCELCWATKGPRWGPAGRGDTSGGCKCLLTKGGKRCHPKCGNCH